MWIREDPLFYADRCRSVLNADPFLNVVQFLNVVLFCFVCVCVFAFCVVEMLLRRGREDPMTRKRWRLPSSECTFNGKLHQCYRDGLIWSVKPILEAKNTSWKTEIMAIVIEVS